MKSIEIVYPLLLMHVNVLIICISADLVQPQNQPIMIEDYQRNFVLKIYYSTNFHKNGLLTNLVFIIKYCT